MKILEEVLPDNQCQKLEDILLSHDFPWYYNVSTANLNDEDVCVDEHTLDNFQFTHVFMRDKKINSDHFFILDPLLKNLETLLGENLKLKLNRIKSNLTFKKTNFPDHFYNYPHIDGNNSKTILYYINHSDGETYIFDSLSSKKNLIIKNKIEPCRNAAIIFDSNILHAGSPPKKHDHRLVLNIIYDKY